MGRLEVGWHGGPMSVVLQPEFYSCKYSGARIGSDLRFSPKGVFVVCNDVNNKIYD